MNFQCDDQVEHVVLGDAHIAARPPLKHWNAVDRRWELSGRVAHKNLRGAILAPFSIRRHIPSGLEPFHKSLQVAKPLCKTSCGVEGLLVYFRPSRRDSVGCRPMAGPQILTLAIEVRILASQPRAVFDDIA